VEAIEASGLGDKVLALRLEHLPDGPDHLLGVPMRLGMGHVLVEQPGVQLVERYMDFLPRFGGERFAQFRIHLLEGVRKVNPLLP